MFTCNAYKNAEGGGGITTHLKILEIQPNCDGSSGLDVKNTSARESRINTI
jgi:hypothetical protein